MTEEALRKLSIKWGVRLALPPKQVLEAIKALEEEGELFCLRTADDTHLICRRPGWTTSSR